MKLYCTECGSPQEYASIKPKFCSECGYSFGGKAAKAAAPPQKEEDDDDIEIPRDIKVSVGGLERDVVSFEQLYKNPVRAEDHGPARRGVDASYVENLRIKATTRRAAPIEIA